MKRGARASHKRRMAWDDLSTEGVVIGIVAIAIERKRMTRESVRRRG
jgi:hypothetical protein